MFSGVTTPLPPHGTLDGALFGLLTVSPPDRLASCAVYERHPYNAKAVDTLLCILFTIQVPEDETFSEGGTEIIKKAKSFAKVSQLWARCSREKGFPS